MQEPLVITPQERDPFQGQHVFVFIGHLGVVFLPHVDEVVAIDKANEFTGVGAGALGIGGEGTACDK